MTKSTIADGGRRQVGVHEAKTHFSELLRAIDSGEEVDIMRNGHVVARLVPAHSGRARSFGHDRGAVVIATDFDAALPVDVLESFES